MKLLLRRIMIVGLIHSSLIVARELARSSSSSHLGDSSDWEGVGDVPGYAPRPLSPEALAVRQLRRGLAGMPEEQKELLLAKINSAQPHELVESLARPIENLGDSSHGTVRRRTIRNLSTEGVSQNSDELVENQSGVTNSDTSLIDDVAKGLSLLWAGLIEFGKDFIGVEVVDKEN
jgi:hypothetical protein